MYKGDELLNNTQFLIAKAHRSGEPVFFTKHNGKYGTFYQKGDLGWEIHPSVTPSKEDIIIEKDHSDSFQRTNLHQLLMARDINESLLQGFN
ncbi:isochorismatase family protein [Lederbergia panacisoli]|nr:isochorismatase family protein [Lederbergia panacisoli]MCR2822111.1 isochorismatase family protein [Lederbergia panacisoli]